MTLLDYAYDLFKGVKQKEYSFTHLMNKKIQEVSLASLEINTIKACLKGVINRYYYLKFEIKNGYGNVDEVLFDYLILGLSLVRYVEKVNVKDVIAFIKDSSNENVKELDLVKLEELYVSLENTVTPIPEKYESIFTKKVSIFYSYPEWLVGMMKKHFGGKNAFNSIASSRRNNPINVCLNPSYEVVDLDESEFRKIEITSSGYDYISKKPLITNPLFVDKKIYVMDAMETLLVDVLNPFQGEEALVIGDNKSMLVTTLALRMYNLGKVYYACKTQDSYFHARKTFDSYKVKNVIPFEGDISLVCTHCEENSLDKVLVVPPNSEFGLIRRKPEIVINFNQSELDSLIACQKEYIKEASKFVKEGGTLVYAVPTLNIKESYNIVRLFLEENKEFELEKEELIFPYIYQTTGMYYAKIIRKTNDVESCNS